MQQLPNVSIIIPNYNGSAYIGNCLDFVNNLDYPQDKIETIVVDDASTDNSLELIKTNFPHVQLIKNSKNLGPAQAKNTGIESAKSDLLVFLDSDVIIDKNWLKPLVKAVRENGKADIACSKVLFSDKKTQINSAGGAVNMFGDAWGRGIFEEDKIQYNNKQKVFYACSASMLVKKDVIKKIGGFDKDYFYLYEDLDFGWRANLAGFKTVYIPDSIAYHNFGSVMKRGTFRVRYLTEKNRILTLLKNYKLNTLIKISSGFFKNRIIKTAKHTQSKNMTFRCFISFFLAWAWNLLHIYKTLKKRTKVQLVRKIPDKEIINLMGEFKLQIFTR